MGWATSYDNIRYSPPQMHTSNLVILMAKTCQGYSLRKS